MSGEIVKVGLALKLPPEHWRENQPDRSKPTTNSDCWSGSQAAKV